MITPCTSLSKKMIDYRPRQGSNLSIAPGGTGGIYGKRDLKLPTPNGVELFK